MGETGYRLTLVCVDQCADGDFSGRLYHPRWQDGRPFHSAVQFLLLVEWLLDQAHTQQSAGTKRTFAASPSSGIPVGEKAPSGLRATFQLRIFFRQNPSWQGSVIWVERRREESFRSVLELLLLMNSAMEYRESDRGSAKVH